MNDVRDNEIDRLEDLHKSPISCGVRHLYKYMRFNPSHPEYLENLFIRKHLYHSNVSNLNDPFECSPHFSFPSNKAQQRIMAKHLASSFREREDISRQEARSIARKVMKDGKTPDLIKNSILKGYQRIRICSFSSTKDSLPMWAYYADSHKGVCIEFGTNSPTFSMTFKVIYKNSYPAATYPLHEDIRGLQYALVKSDQWSHEREFRSIRVPSSPTSPIITADNEGYFLHTKDITGVFIGAQASEENIRFIFDLVDRSEFSPQVWKGNISTGSYGITFEKVR